MELMLQDIEKSLMNYLRESIKEENDNINIKTALSKMFQADSVAFFLPEEIVSMDGKIYKGLTNIQISDGDEVKISGIKNQFFSLKFDKAMNLNLLEYILTVQILFSTCHKDKKNQQFLRTAGLNFINAMRRVIAEALAFALEQDLKIERKNEETLEEFHKRQKDYDDNITQLLEYEEESQFNVKPKVVPENSRERVILTRFLKEKDSNLKPEMSDREKNLCSYKDKRRMRFGILDGFLSQIKIINQTIKEKKILLSGLIKNKNLENNISSEQYEQIVTIYISNAPETKDLKYQYYEMLKQLIELKDEDEKILKVVLGQEGKWFKGLSDNGCHPKTGSTLLHYATDKPKIMQYLLDNKTELKLNPNVENSYGYTPLFCSIAEGNLQTAKLLIKSGEIISDNLIQKLTVYIRREKLKNKQRGLILQVLDKIQQTDDLPLKRKDKELLRRFVAKHASCFQEPHCSGVK